MGFFYAMTKPTTQWKPVVGYEGLYEISENGQLKNLKTNRFIKPSIKSGYLGVTISKNGILKTISIHRLVAIAFIDNPKNKKFVNHKNGIKTDNHVNNLEWCNQKYNNIHAIETGLRPTKINREIAENIRKEIENNNIEELSIKYNISISHIKKILRYERWN